MGEGQKRCDNGGRGWSDERKGHKSQNAKECLKTWQGKGADSPLEPQEECSPSDTLILGL